MAVHQRQLAFVYLFGVPAALGILFGCLQLGAAAALPLHTSILAWVGFAYIYWVAFETAGFAIGWLVRPLKVPLVVILVGAAIVGKIAGRPFMLEYGEIFQPYLSAGTPLQPKPYSQFTLFDLAGHLWNNMPLMLSWVIANLYFHNVLGLARFGHRAEVEAEPEHSSPELPGVHQAAPVAPVVPHSTGIVALAHALPKEIVSLSAEDHYVRVRHNDGRSQLILYRFTTALAEFVGEDGLQVHRSHWVRRSAVEQGIDFGRSGQLLLPGGVIIPVSHAYLQLVRQSGLFTRTARAAASPPIAALS